MEKLFRSRKALASADVVKALNADPTSFWRNFRGKGPITQTQLSALFRPYGINTVKVGTLNGYRAEQFSQVFARLLPGGKSTGEPENRRLPQTKRRSKAKRQLQTKQRKPLKRRKK
jgi:hypothetical protein